MYKRQEQTRAVLVVEAEAQLLHVRKNGCTHIRFDVNAHQMPQIGDDPLRERAQDEKPQHRKHHEDERAQRLIGNVIDVYKRQFYGSSTEIGGDFAPSSWWTNNATDKLIRDLTNDYGLSLIHI